MPVVHRAHYDLNSKYVAAIVYLFTDEEQK